MHNNFFLFSGYRAYGTPTVRSDIPAPRIRRIDDTTNYGDGSDVLGLVSPSIYSAYGVYERDFLCPRPREQVGYCLHNNILYIEIKTV